MDEWFLDAAALDGQGRIRQYVLAWLERLDYAGKLERSWPAEELGPVIWGRIERDFAAHWEGPVVTNRPLAEVIASTMVEDYFASYSVRRESRYSVAGPLPDNGFRRCVLDFLHDIEEFEGDRLPVRPEAAADAFWDDVKAHPQRWGYSERRGPFVDDPDRARAVALETIREYYDLREQVERQRAEARY